jgi:DNA-binding CsgD family transcriptional regulator
MNLFNFIVPLPVKIKIVKIAYSDVFKNDKASINSAWKIKIMNELDACIARLYRLSALGTKGYRRRALTELAQVIDFDGALWGTGHLDSEGFHSVDVLGVDESYPKALAKYKTINPFFDALKTNPAQTVDMMQVMPDDAFYESPVYLQFFSEYSVERVMGVLLPDENTGIMSLVSLYRFDRHKPFSKQDRITLERMVYHLVQAASHAYFLHLEYKKDADNNVALAICDRHGLFFEVQPGFMDLLVQNYSKESLGRMPFFLKEGERVEAKGNLQVKSDPLGDLLCVSLWQTSPMDLLSAREKQVTQAITKGLSFKEAAKEIGVAPSTVSNHLYKIYRKLKITSRTELAQWVNSK